MYNVQKLDNSFFGLIITSEIEKLVYKGAPIVPAKPMRPMFGMNPVLLDDKGNELEGNDQSGALCLKVSFSEIKRFVDFDLFISLPPLSS